MERGIESARYERGAWAVYTLFQLCMLAAIEYLRVSAPVAVSGKVMFAAVGLNTLVALVGFAKAPQHRLSARLLMSGLVLTCAADVCLCLIRSWGYFEPVQTAGYALFAAAQAVYAVYLGHSRLSVAARILCWVAALAAAQSVGLLSILSAFALADLSILAVNVAVAWHRHSSTTLALMLFAGCDFSLLFCELLPAGSTAQAVFGAAVWAFYLPSQVLLVRCLEDECHLSTPVHH